MQTLESQKRKIGSADDLRSVVTTMKTLAAVSIRQYETATDSLTEYAQTVEDGLRMVLWQSSDTLQSSAVDGRTGAIVFGSDQGMCGQFNEQIANYVIGNLHGKSDDRDESSIVAVGARVVPRLQDAGFQVEVELPVASSATGIASLVQDLLPTLDAWHSHRRFRRIVLFFNRRHSTSSYHPHQMQLLPVDTIHIEQLRQKTWSSRTLPTFTMGRSRLFSSLIHQYLFVTLFRACAESLAGENASRIASMQAAERNIEERLAELRAGYNQLRQTSITEELLDVVTGFEALTQE